MEEEKVYLNYGDLQVDLALLLTNMANQVLNYVNQQSWSGKRKLKFMDAYTDLVNKGLRGATNTSGRWQVEVGGDVDVESMDRKDREMYQEAAYFIQQLMQGLATAKLAEEEAKKAEMQKFDFLSGFAKHLNNTMAGGQQLQIGGENDLWNYLDERGTNGLRGINKRANKLADMLQTYSDSLDASKLDFTDTPYLNLDDFKAKVNTAIAALRSGDMNNIRPTLNAIGLNPTEFFYDGSGDLYGVDTNGNPVTYAKQAQALAAEEAAKAQEAQLQAYLEALANKGVLNWDNGIHSKEARISPKAYAEFLSKTYGVGETGFNNINARIQKLIEGSYNKGLSAADKKELGNLLYYVRTNNPNYKGLGFGKATNLSDADWAELRTHTNHLSSVTRENFVRLPWKTSDGRITYADNQGNLYFLKPANRKQIADPKFTRSAEYNNYKNNFLKAATLEGRRQLADERIVTNGDFLAEDYLRMAAMGLDIIGTVAALMPGYGTAASGILGLGSLGANTAADLIDDSVSRGQVAKNAAINLGLGVVGLVPGLGLAGKTGKWIAAGARWVPKILTMAAAGLIALDDDIKKSLSKLTTNEKLTVHDWKNVGYALSTVAGTARMARGVVSARKYEPAFKGKQETKEYITTKKGTKVEITKELLKNLNKKGTKEGNEAANKYLNEEILKNPLAKEEVNIEFKTGKLSSFRSPKVKSEPKIKSVTPDKKTQVYLRALAIENERRKAGSGFYKFAPRFLPTDYDIYAKAYNINTPNIGLIDKMKKLWSPVRESRLKQSSTTSTKTTPSATETPKPTTTTSKTKPLTTEEVKELRESLAGKRLSTNPLKSDEAMTVKGFGDVYLMDNKNGTHTLEFQLPNGNKFSITSKEADIKLNTAKFLKETLNKININAKSDKDRIKLHISLELIKKLKSVGALKQGGKITDTQIDNFLNQYK